MIESHESIVLSFLVFIICCGIAGFVNEYYPPWIGLGFAFFFGLGVCFGAMMWNK